MKKYIFIFTFLSLLLLTIKISSNHTPPSTQIIINTSYLDNYEVLSNIENEISKMRGISSYEFSLSSGSALINYNDKQIDNIDILAAFDKWGCKNYDISYNFIF